jgi:hypothetical protein
MDDAPYTGDLDLDSVSTREDLARLLRAVHIRADKPSLRTLEARTRHGPTPLGKTATAEMLKGVRFPRKTVMLAFLRACGIPEDGMEPWRRTWERVAGRQEASVRPKTVEAASDWRGRSAYVVQYPPSATRDPSVVVQTERVNTEDLTTGLPVSTEPAGMIELRDQINRLKSDNESLRAQLATMKQTTDALPEEYLRFIGLEAEATSVAHWEVAIVPGLLQTEEYARHLHVGYQGVMPIPPGVVERRVRMRMIRQEVLVRNPPLQLSVVIDESVLLRRIGGHEVMHTQLLHLAEVADLPNVDLRVLPLSSETSLMAGPFVIFGFSSDPINGRATLRDVVSTENVIREMYEEGETDTYVYRLVFQGLVKASLSPSESQRLIRRTAAQVWSLVGLVEANLH